MWRSLAARRAAIGFATRRYTQMFCRQRGALSHRPQQRNSWRELFSSVCVRRLNTKTLKGVWHCAAFLAGLVSP